MRGVGGMDGGHGTKIVVFWKRFEGVVMFHDFDDVFLNAPKREEICADLGVSGAEALGFGFVQWEVAGASEGFHFGVFIGGVGEHDDFADVMQEAGEEGFFALFVV